MNPVTLARRAPLLVAAALIGPGPALAAPGGPLGTLPLGKYRCELPGDAEGLAGIAQPAEDFAVIHGSGYTTLAGRGVYLMTGSRVEFTSGPLRGVVYSHSGRAFLRRLSPDGSEGPLRCVRAPNSGR